MDKKDSQNNDGTSRVLVSLLCPSLFKLGFSLVSGTAFSTLHLPFL